jgi:lipopolysaccharide transport system ATP-binding protein
MADKIAIQVKNLGKQYRLGGPQEKYYTLRDAITSSLQAPMKIFHKAPPVEGFWALRDVSFDIEQGEIVGIIGRNGAGKSTLLKILSRITTPTEGIADIYGRVGSLLEVGTGFHPELTGRENIYLSGSILGMKQREIDGKLDEIVKFSEIERFLDTPVKRFSSGMYVRLAFAVAAHLEPEILLVDEVLAVGDAAFQKKCLGKMGEVAKEGRTVLFVSHNMAAIRQLCPRTILIENGKKSFDGSSENVVNKYLHNNNFDFGQSVVDLSNYQPRQGSGVVKFLSAKIQNSDHLDCSNFSIGEDIRIVFNIKPNPDFTGSIKLAVQIQTLDNLQICNMVDVDSGFNIGQIKERTIVSVVMKDIRLYPGIYCISLWAGSLSSTESYDFIKDILCFHIVDGGLLTTRSLPRSGGLFFFTPVWEVKNNE